MQQKQRVIDLFLRTMLYPKLGITFCRYHSEQAAGAAEKDKVQTLEEHARYIDALPNPDIKDVPKNIETQNMSRNELRNFLYATCLATSRADGHEVIKPHDLAMTEAQLLNMAGIEVDTENKDKDVQVPQGVFSKLCMQLAARICYNRADALPIILKLWGLGQMKLPKFVQTEQEKALAEVMEFANENVRSHLVNHLKEMEELNKDDDDEWKRCGLADLCIEIKKGIEASGSKNYIIGQMLKLVSTVNNTEGVLGQLKVHRDDKKTHRDLVIRFVMSQCVYQVLLHDPDCAPYIFKYWGIDMSVEGDEDADKAEADAEAVAKITSALDATTLADGDQMKKEV